MLLYITCDKNDSHFILEKINMKLVYFKIKDAKLIIRLAFNKKNLLEISY